MSLSALDYLAETRQQFNTFKQTELTQEKIKKLFNEYVALKKTDIGAVDSIVSTLCSKLEKTIGEESATLFRSDIFKKVETVVQELKKSIKASL